MTCKIPRRLFVVIALGILLRLGVAFYLGDIVEAPPLLVDQRSYHALAVRLLQGHGYSFGQYWYPFTPPDTPTAHWSFLYPLFLAAVYALFGVHPLAARLAQAVLGGILLPWMVYRLASRMLLASRAAPLPDRGATGPPAPGPGAPACPPEEAAARADSAEGRAAWLPLLAAALAACCYGYYLLYAAALMTETFYIVALLWSLEVGLRVATRFRAGQAVPWPLALELGLSLVVAALLRQSFLPWAPVLYLWLLWQARGRVSLGRALGPLVLAGVVLLLGILPWTIRNYRVYGQFLLLNSNTGYAMYSAQHPMHGARFSEFAAAPLPDNLKGANEAQWDRELMRIGLQFVRDDPWRYLRLCASRARAYFEFWPTPDTTLLHNIGRVASFGFWLPFMLYGLILAGRGSQRSLNPDPHQHPPHPPLSHVVYGRGAGGEGFSPFAGWVLSLPYLFMIFYPLVHIATWAMVRYRLPVDAVALIFAALALQDLYGRTQAWVVARRATHATH